MSDEINRADSAKAAALQGDDRIASITPQGEALNQSRSTEEQVKSVPKTKGHTGQVWAQHMPGGDPDQGGGFPRPDPADHPGDLDHRGGDPDWDGDAQYGASPLRSARYKEDHQANANMAEGKRDSGNFGSQVRYPNAEETR